MEKQAIEMTVADFVKTQDNEGFQKLVTMYRHLALLMSFCGFSKNDFCWGCCHSSRLAILETAIDVLLEERGYSATLLFAHNERIQKDFELVDQKLKIKGCIGLDSFIEEVKTTYSQSEIGKWIDDEMFGRL